MPPAAYRSARDPEATMPVYSWKGKNKMGKMQQGTLSADTKDAVIGLLRRQQIMVSAVTEKGKELAIPTFGGGVSEKEIAIFTRQFSVMIDAGLPLVQCLEILGTQQNNKVFAKTIVQERQDVESGQSLSEALKKHPKITEDRFCNMTDA